MSLFKHNGKVVEASSKAAAVRKIINGRYRKASAASARSALAESGKSRSSITARVVNTWIDLHNIHDYGYEDRTIMVNKGTVFESVMPVLDKKRIFSLADESLRGFVSPRKEFSMFSCEDGRVVLCAAATVNDRGVEASDKELEQFSRDGSGLYTGDINVEIVLEEHRKVPGDEIERTFA